MTRGPARGRAHGDARSVIERFGTAVYGALYCLGSVYVVPPIDTAVVLRELTLGCDARRGIREFERLLAVGG